MSEPNTTPKSAVTNLCTRIRAELEFFDHRRRAFDEISAGIYLTLTEWQMILDRLEIRDAR
jgi:hypothetical protein